MSEEKPEMVEVQVKLPEKVKKPRSEAQIAATKANHQKALLAMKEKREAREKVEKEVKESKEIEKEKWREVKKAKLPAEDLVTKKDLDDFMTNVKSLLTAKSESPSRESLGPPAAVQKTTVVKREIPAAPTKVVAPPPAPVKLSGHELLDRLFFNA